jgi:hypothetical protein
MTIVDLLKKLFGKRKKAKKIIYETPVPPEVTKRELDEAFQKELGQEKARADRLEEEVLKLKKQLEEERKKQLMKEFIEAREMEKAIAKERKRNRKIFLFRDDGRLPYVVSAYDNEEFFRDGTGKEWKIWRGFVFENTANGVMFNLILGNPKEKAISVLRGVPFERLPDLFNLKSLFTDVKIGKIPINLTKEGMFISPTMYSEPVNADEIDNRDIQRMLKIDVKGILANADKQTKQAFYTLYKRYNQALNYAMEAEEREKEALMEKQEAELAARASMKMVEKSVPTLSMVTKKLEDAYGDLAPTIIKEQEARLKVVGMEALVQAMWDALDDALQRIKQIGKAPEERALKKIEDQLQFAFRSLSQFKRKIEEERGA